MSNEHMSFGWGSSLWLVCIEGGMLMKQVIK
ncbi:hypothetical protein AJ85_03130 [Alkalihalobacillus alcalophilus ATCC 27647 = CGMCC 1.3604]|uniref:Uncharacterized protein n=1 Tax=Alkalihalobacillus alcalophilus ATCC 27647 = CGMCC 1.3604 TaxID=1218173 RepID=A0A4S4JV59_ALKAL|nr:hypothetical protein AJ85_03130 [Alkalihalobacillus alcalophilus ATCC 27647 = CGMCC 1.3604]